MIIQGKLIAESPIYRGNARKTLFTRDDDGKNRLISLAGEIQGTAQALMDAFIGQSRNGKNIGLINQLWQRLYGKAMPPDLIKRVECKLNKNSYPADHFFDLRMGIKLDEDRWAAEANANYKMETILRHSVFDFVMTVNEGALGKQANADKLYFLLQELIAGRFWFGAGKSKGLGRVRLESKLPLPAPSAPPAMHSQASHLQIKSIIDAENPVLIGWNWGKIDPLMPSFSGIEGRMLIESMKAIPDPVSQRLSISLGGAILNTEDWKKKFSELLPRVIAIWLKEQSAGEKQVWVLPEVELNKMGKGKYALNKKILAKLKQIANQPFESKEAASKAVELPFGKKANLAKRVIKVLEQQSHSTQSLDKTVWAELSGWLGLGDDIAAAAAKVVDDEAALTTLLTPVCQRSQSQIFLQVDQQIKLMASDNWVDAEVETRNEHLSIKKQLKAGKITEMQWNDPEMPPEGIRPVTWRAFCEEHRRVAYRHMLNRNNLDKSITNDENQIEFLESYRNKTRQELSRPDHIDFRAGGPFNREISQGYGKPYDKIFMRMLTWKPSQQQSGAWEIYIPGSTIKGAFRKRASQLLKTLWGDTRQVFDMLNCLFGAQGRRGLVYFSDAYLVQADNPEQHFCALDGVQMDPKNGKPIESAKRDMLYAYGKSLAFSLSIDLQDIQQSDLTAVGVLLHLLEDFQRGDIALGGEKTKGFGWVKAQIDTLTWLSAKNNPIGQKLFGKQKTEACGIWQKLTQSGQAAANLLKPFAAIKATDKNSGSQPFVTPKGFISHKLFGGFCGKLIVEANVLTQLAVRESGQPSFAAQVDGQPIYGFDFFSMSPPKNEQRAKDREYALPAHSLRGALRHIYTIASDAKAQSTDISRLNPADSLFGWVGQGPNQAIMGRVVIDFAKFNQPKLAWFKLPYPYGDWQYQQSGWKSTPQAKASKIVIDNQWRLFAHAPLAPIVSQIDGFQPDDAQAAYVRAMLPGCRAQFGIRFWNLTEAELSRLIWCVALEPGLAHKMGNHRYVGLGSLAFSILPDSYLIDWSKRYGVNADPSQWKRPVDVDKWLAKASIKHKQALTQALHAKHL